MNNEYNDDNWASLQYIAYYSDSKNLICFSHNKKNVELYLMRLDIYDKATLFESTNVKFNMALFNVFEAFELCIIRSLNGTPIILTRREQAYVEQNKRKVDYKIQNVCNDLNELVCTLNLNDKEYTRIRKCINSLKKRQYIMDEVEGTVPKGLQTDLKTIHRLTEMEHELNCFDNNNSTEFNMFCGSYYIILI